MTETAELIETLVAAAMPVKRLPSPFVRMALWVGGAAAVIAALIAFHGVRPDWNTQIGQPAFQFSLLAALATGVLAALAAFMASLPDRSRRWLLLPIPAVCVWVATIGLGCLNQWVKFDDATAEPHEVLRCVSTLLLSSVPLSALMFWMLRHTATLRPTGALPAAGLAAGAFTAVALSVGDFQRDQVGHVRLPRNFGRICAASSRPGKPLAHPGGEALHIRGGQRRDQGVAHAFVGPGTTFQRAGGDGFQRQAPVCRHGANEHGQADALFVLVHEHTGWATRRRGKAAADEAVTRGAQVGRGNLMVDTVRHPFGKIVPLLRTQFGGAAAIGGEDRVVGEGFLG